MPESIVRYEETDYPASECPRCDGGNRVGVAGCGLCYGTGYVKPVRVHANWDPKARYE